MRCEVRGTHRELEDVLGDRASSSEHGNTAVLDLSLAEELDVAEGRDAERVEAHVADHGAVELLRLVQEGHRRRLGLHLRADGR